MEKQFKNYKEKQKYYKQRSKETKMFWVSKEPKYNNKKNTIIKGRTYIKENK
jgi:hypothetical protein|nr:MAG TPA: hypothetical protein [Caudoviricetes sp.]